MTKTRRAREPVAIRPRLQLGERARAVGCFLSSVGDVEQLAGVDVRSHAERTALWGQFLHLFTGPSQLLIDAVMDHCSGIALERLERGELCLLPTHY